MIFLLRYLVYIRTEESLVDTLGRAGRMYMQGNFSLVNEIYENANGKFQDNAKFQSEYIDFLIKTGQYEKIVKMENLKEANLALKQKAKEYLDIINTNSFSEISKLVGASPNSFTVVISAAKAALFSENYGEFSKFIKKAEILDAKSNLFKELKGHYSFLVGNEEEGLSLFSEIGLSSVVNDYKRTREEVRSAMQRMEAGRNDFQKFKSVLRIIIAFKSSGTFYPSIYSSMYVKYAIALIQKACDVNYKDGISSIASDLLKFKEDNSTIFLYIRASAINWKIQEAKYAMSKYKQTLKESQLRYLTTLISMEENKMAAERERREEQRRREDQRKREEQHRRRSSMGGSAKKGEDFLGYYKTLGINSRANQDAIKKAYKTKVKEANKLARKKKVKGDNEELKKVNKAYQILSKDESKQMYDAGVDPENPQANMGGGGYHGGKQFYEDNDLNEVLKMFFGQNGGGRRQQQHFYFYR